MKYLIGIDGGATKTKCILTDLELNELYKCEGGSSAFLTKGTGQVCETIFSLIDECIRSHKINNNDIQSIVIGSTGAGRKKDAERLKNAFIEFAQSKGFVFNSFIVESDARIALEGAFRGESGCILISGTGSIIFGKDDYGNIHRVGGLGKLIGDEGSGYQIGRKGLNAVGKHYDGRGLQTKLSALVYEHFNIKDSSQMIDEVYNKSFDIASVAPLVIKAAQDNDEISLNIIEEECEELILHLRSMKKVLNTNSLKVSLTGSLLTTDNYYSRMFKEKVKKALPNLQILTAQYPPEMGAVLLAKQQIK